MTGFSKRAVLAFAFLATPALAFATVASPAACCEQCDDCDDCDDCCDCCQDGVCLMAADRADGDCCDACPLD